MHERKNSEKLIKESNLLFFGIRSWINWEKGRINGVESQGP